MKIIVVHSAAERELKTAFAHYEREREGLGTAFLEQAEAAIARIQATPRLFPLHGTRGCRKCFVRRFPYTIYFQELSTQIWIAAIAHQKRRPNYWARRKP